MNGSFTLQVRCHPDSLRQVRESLLSLELEPDALYALTVVAHELVANSIRHSDLTEEEQIEIEVRCHGSYARIEVRDGGTGFTAPQQSMETGRGFPMVQALSRHFGISRNGQTQAWAEVELPDPLSRSPR
jgi:anti-sigma regulatory factor (Ser/Thr protein kinase)